MLASERKKQRKLAKNNRRQARFRERQKAAGLDCLQVSISRLAHSKALELSEKLGCRLVDVYAMAIKNTNLDHLPAKHDEVLEGELIGYKQISPWTDQSTVERFERIAKHYRTRPIAMSAIVYAYCDKSL